MQVVGNASGVIMHACCIGVLYYAYDLGYTGVIWSTAMVFVGRFIGVQAFIRCNSSLQYCDDVLFFTKETFSNLGDMVRVSVHSMFMGIWGWWAFEILTFMAMYLGKQEAAAQSIMRSMGLLTYMLPVGYSFASAILSGNSIGAGRPNEAITYYKVCMLLACFITVLQMSVLWFAREGFFNMYTDIEVLKV